MRLTDRDMRILDMVRLFGCLTCVQIAALFNMHLKVAQRRTRQLVVKLWQTGRL